jgi:DNA topoisomerase-1
MIVDRQKEIDAFRAVKYWTIEVTLSTGKEEFVVQVVQKDKLSISTAEMAEKIVKYLEEQEFVVESVDKSQERKNPPAPFTTSTLQQVGSGALSWKGNRTMEVAQKLYEGGHISYMRTDSVTIVQEAVDGLRTLIPTITGPKYLPTAANVYQNKSKNAQEAHEAVRITHFDDLPQILMGVHDSDEKKLVELIWRRTVASQMVPAIYNKVEVVVKAGKVALKASGQTQVFDGYLKIWTHTDAKELALPDLTSGQKLTKIKIESVEHETKPPARYTDASLVKELESNGVGRPSTYATVAKTLLARGYVKVSGKAYEATPKGVEVSDFLKEHFSNLINVSFTAQMETELDEVAEGKKTRLELLRKFYKELSDTIEVVKTKFATNEVSAEACPVCKSQLFVKLNRKDNQRFLACSNKDCKKTFNMDKDEKPVERQIEKLATPCPECGGELRKMTSSKGTVFYGCENYKGKGCKVTANERGEIRVPPKDTGKKCKKCKKGTMLERKNRTTGELFYGCSNYPKCKNAESAK